MATTTTDRICENCYVWQRFAVGRDDSGNSRDTRNGLCKRHSPVIVDRNGENGKSVFPKTRDVDFCGDFENRIEVFGDALDADVSVDD